METEIFDIAILALPNAVFFPRTLLTVHVSEPSRRAVVANCLAGDQRLGVALMKNHNGSPAPGAQAPARPPINKILGVGAIVDHETLPDGRYSLKLEGICRAMILDELSRPPHRSARVEVVKDFYDVSRREELVNSHERLARQTRILAERLPQFTDLIDRILSSTRHPGILADLLAHHFVVDLYDRQSILAEYDLIRRVDLVAIQMEDMVRRLRREQRKAS